MKKIKEYFEDLLFDLKYYIRDKKYKFLNFIRSLKLAYSFYKDIKKGYICTYEGKCAIYSMSKILIPLINKVLETHDIKWAEKFYKIENLENRLIKLKENIEFYNKKYVQNEYEYTGPCKAFEYLSEKNFIFENTVFYITLENEYYRQKKLLEKEIFDELKDLLPFLWI